MGHSRHALIPPHELIAVNMRLLHQNACICPDCREMYPLPADDCPYCREQRRADRKREALTAKLPVRPWSSWKDGE